MSQLTGMPAKVLATPEGLVVADHPDNEAYFQHQKDQIGKRKLNRDREATLEERFEDTKKSRAHNRVIGGRVKKESLTDDDAREVAVATLDEQMLDLQAGDMDSSANTKLYNELRDMRAIIVDLEPEDGFSYAGVARERADQMLAEGSQDEAGLAYSAAELLAWTRDGFLDSGVVDYSSDGYAEQSLDLVQGVIADHNARVARNEQRRSADGAGMSSEALEAAKFQVQAIETRS